MEPATVLIAPLEIEIGREGRLRRMRSPQYGEVGRTRVKPDIERIGVFDIPLRGVGAFVAKQLCRIECLPGLDTTGFDALRDLFK